MNIQSAVMQDWYGRFQQALMRLRQPPKYPMSAGLRSMIRNEMLTYGTILASTKDAENEGNAPRRIAARDIYLEASLRLNELLKSSLEGREKFTFLYPPPSGTFEERVEQAQVERDNALELWIES